MQVLKMLEDLMDRITPETKLYVPMTIGASMRKEVAHFDWEIETVFVFLTKKDAELYSNLNEKISSTSRVSHANLINFCQKMSNKHQEIKRLKCVLATIDRQGQIHELLKLWDQLSQ